MTMEEVGHVSGGCPPAAVGLLVAFGIAGAVCAVGLVLGYLAYRVFS
jgi:hypothetical protein